MMNLLIISQNKSITVIITTIIGIFCIFTAGCEQPFEPLQENERHFFSINGYLDASVDTQWVRVMPVRESLILESGMPVPTVTLQHIDSGETVVMQDSVFHYAGERYAYNFWTTMPVLPEESYRIRVEGPEGRSSSAVATLPKDFPIPRFREPEFNADILIIEEVERLADVQVIYRIRMDRTGEVFEAAFPYLEHSVSLADSTYRVAINPSFGRVSIMEMYCDITVIERNAFIASGGPGWLDFLSLGRHVIALPDGVTNVENGVGFFGGIISKTFPYVNVEGDRGLFSVPCPT